MCHLLQMADAGQHGQNGLYQHPIVPFSALADTQVGREPIHFGKPCIGKNNHLVTDPLTYMLEMMLEMTAIIYIGSVAIPIHNQPKMVDQYTQFSADNLSLVGESFFADLTFRPTCSTGVNQFDAISINHTHQ